MSGFKCSPGLLHERTGWLSVEGVGRVPHTRQGQSPFGALVWLIWAQRQTDDLCELISPSAYTILLGQELTACGTYCDHRPSCLFLKSTPSCSQSGSRNRASKRDQEARWKGAMTGRLAEPGRASHSPVSGEA